MLVYGVLQMVEVRDPIFIYNIISEWYVSPKTSTVDQVVVFSIFRINNIFVLPRNLQIQYVSIVYYQLTSQIYLCWKAMVSKPLEHLIFLNLKVFHHLTYNITHPKSAVLVLSFLHLRFSSV